jgi:hippurate hydrolase
VVSICVFQAGTTNNVIPQTAKLAGTIRSLTDKVRDQLEARVREIVEGVAALHGGQVRLTYTRGYPVTENHVEQTAFAQEVASEIAGGDRVNGELPPMMGAEDFSYMLNARPGAFVFVGNGDSAGLHHPAYDFNDDIIPIGSSYWVRLVEKALAG